MEFENISASYDVGIAKKYGIQCAVLLNKLLYLSNYSSREDGYCWRTAKELEDELGLTRNQQDLAIKKLVDEGIIEVKNTYIVGTQVKCKHFRIISKSQMIESSKCDLLESSKSEMQESSKSVNNNKNSNNKTIIKHKYGEYKNVLLTDDEYIRLNNDYSNCDELIKYLDEYIEMKGYKAKSHNLAIRKWVVSAVEEHNKKNKMPNWFDKNMEKDLKNLDELNDILKDFE
jgi:hypothetical protein